MNIPLFTDSQFEHLAEAVRRVLRETGFHVGHERVKRLALAGGCRESAGGRVLFDDVQVRELAARLQAQYPPAAAADPRRLLHPRRTTLGTSYGNLPPKVYDVVTRTAVGGDTRQLTRLVRFAHSAPYITALALPLSRRDVPAEIEQVDGLVQMARLTDKPLGDLDVTVPQAVPYVARMGEVLGRDPARFVGGCNCINPPLRLEARTAATLLQRASLHALSMITPMPCLGGTSPADTCGSIVQGTAEIVGGLILSVLVDPEAPLLGYIASTQLDMRTGNMTSSSPQTVQVDAGVYQLMERHFGGGTRIGGRTYVSAKRPGFQAVVEKLLKAQGYSLFADDQAFLYAGGGTLDNGSLTSPEQLLLDLEIVEGFACLTQVPPGPDPDDIVRRLREGVEDLDGNFLLSDHTVRHHRDEPWDPRYFRRATETRSEEEMLAQAHEEVERRLSEYRPAAHPEATLRALEAIAAEARAALLGGGASGPAAN